MGETLDDWREFFRTTDTDIFEFIDTAITLAALDCPRDFRLQRDCMAERLFSTAMTQNWRPGCDDLPMPRDGGVDSVRVDKESKRIGGNSRGVVECDGVDMNPESYHDYGGPEAFSDENDEQSQVIGEFLRIKQVLDNSQRESDSALYESLRKLRLMTVSMDVLEKTKIGITLNSLRRKGRSTRIARLAHNIIMSWKAMVEEICRSTKDVADSYGGPEAFSDEIDEQSQVIGEVLRIKQVLDNRQHESDSTLYQSLRKLQLMTISMDLLEIGITVNSLRRKGGSMQIAQLAHTITMGWKAMVREICRSTNNIAAENSFVDPHKLEETDCADRPTASLKNQNIPIWHREKHSNEAGSIAKKNQRPNMNQHLATVKPNTSSSIDSKTIPPSKIATQKFEKERMLQNSNGIMGCKRLFTGQWDKINGSDEVAVEKKFGASKRILQEHYQQAESAKRQQTVLALTALPKQPSSHKGPGPCARIEKTLRQMAKSRRRISLF